MKEADWLNSSSPRGMLCQPPRKIRPFTDRKLRLFAIACCRRVWDLLHDGRSRAAVEALERFVEGAETEERMAGFARGASLGASRISRSREEFRSRGMGRIHLASVSAAYAVSSALHDFSLERRPSGSFAMFIASSVDAAARAEYERSEIPEAGQPLMYDRIDQSIQANLLHDIMGNPYRRPVTKPVTIDPRWATPNVLDLASVIYETGDFGSMPYLGDALEEAGCDREDMLSHCRGLSEHVRGCWVVDAVLGKG